MHAQRMFPLVLAAWLVAGGATALAAEGGDADQLAKKIGAGRGICVLVGDKQCRLAIGLARQSGLTLYVQLARAIDAAGACRAADAAGLFGTRVFVAQAPYSRIGLADNLADALIVADPGAAVQKAEILRVLRPEGKALVGDEAWVKPLPEGIDDWSHHYHGPDNNPQSRDALARAPFLTQFVAEPRYAPAPQAAVASGGRVFMAFGHVAWHEREEPWMNTLLAVSGYSGTTLWKRPLTPGIMVDRCTMVATPSVLFLADDKSCKLLDAATGEVKDEIAAPADLAGGTFWKWIAVSNGVLYGLVGPAEPPDPNARWRRTVHGWPWNEMSKLYNDGKHLWGFGKVLMAVDLKTKRTLWTHQEDPLIDGRTLCMTGGRIYFCHFGRYLKCLDAAGGKTVWQRSAEKDPDIFEAIGPYRADQGPVQGWKTNVYMKCTDKALYFAGPQVPWLTALSAADGSVLFKHQARDLHIVIRDDALYTIGPANAPEETKKLDPLTGRILATYPTRRRSCTRATGCADGIFFRGHEGTGRLDVAAGHTAWTSAMRPSCQIGVLVAAGHLYWIPWTCDCNLQVFGVIACGPAGEFAFGQKAAEAERLETPGGDRPIAAFELSPRDWPAYRADAARSAQTRADLPRQVKTLWQYLPSTASGRGAGAEGNTLPSPASGRGAGGEGSSPAIDLTAPVAAGGLVFAGGSDGIVRAIDAASGQVRWTAYTGGAVTYPPTIAAGRALVGSGDGWAYAFEAATGRPLWRFRAAPQERRIPFYGSLRSTWPVASGVLVDQGTAYFAAGINDFDGSHVYALDAATGRIRWQNNTAGHLDPVSRRGVTCQGEMLLDGARLFLAGGNSVSPGVFDAATGQCLNQAPASMGAAAPRGRELVLRDGRVTTVGQPLYSRPEAPVFDQAVRWDPPVVAAPGARLLLRQAKADGPWSLVAEDAKDSSPLWQQELPAAPVRWGIAVDARGRIFVSLGDGRLMAFGG